MDEIERESLDDASLKQQEEPGCISQDSASESKGENLDDAERVESGRISQDSGPERMGENSDDAFLRVEEDAHQVWSVSRDGAEGESVLSQNDQATTSQEMVHEMERDVPGDASPGLAEDQELADDVKREMLADICKGVVILKRKSDVPGGDCYVYLVGTAHVSQESCREVQAATRLLKPQVVFLELCEKRRFMLASTHFQEPTLKEMLGMWQERRLNFLGILYSWFLAKVAAKMDVSPGLEFRVAYEEAKACRAKVVLGDRDVQVTLRRTWSRMSLWHKIKFVFSMVFQAVSLPSVEDLQAMIQELQDVDMLTLAFQELGKSFPTLMETLVHERDMFMAAVLQKVAEHHASVVAVVGKGHIPGIAKNWDREISVHTLMEVPRKKPLWTTSSKLLFSGALTVLVVAFATAKFSNAE